MTLTDVHRRYLSEWVSTRLRCGLAIDTVELEALAQFAAQRPDAAGAYELAPLPPCPYSVYWSPQRPGAPTWWTVG